MPEDMPDRMPEDLRDRMPEDMPEDMPDRMPNRMSEDMSDRMPEDMPEDMPDRMPNRMSEDMSDRMPEDVPVRTCINVMVGITRSKVIFFRSTRGLMGTVYSSIDRQYRQAKSLFYIFFSKTRPGVPSYKAAFPCRDHCNCFSSEKVGIKDLRCLELH